MQDDIIQMLNYIEERFLSMAERENGKQYPIDILAALSERTINRLWVIIILLILYCGVMTYLYIDERNSYETIESEVSMEAPEGYLDHVYVSGVGDVYYYGESESEG